MAAGVPRFVTVNVGQLEAECDTGAAVDAASLGRLVEASGAAGRLPLKVLGGGDLSKALTVSAAAFSATAAAKIEAAGGKAVVVPVKAKWTRPDRKVVKAAAVAAAAAAAEAGGGGGGEAPAAAAAEE
jgi:large subunit ribosomal protein L15